MTEQNTKKIHSAMIIEVIGGPKEYLIETLNNFINQIKEEKGVEIIDFKVNEPVELKERKEMFSDFAEIEVKTDSLFTLTTLMFKYMPSHVEMIYPENLDIQNHDMNDLLNEIIRRLHAYDGLARVFQIEKQRMLEEIEKLKKENSKKN